MAIVAVFYPNLKRRAVREFKIQILDFIRQNPCPKTVQWSAVMDASIRAVNVLVAYDIYRQIDDGKELDKLFSLKFMKWIKEHGEYIINNLEYSSITSNHYFSNIVGMLFISAYLPQSKKTDAWLAFSVQELIAETRKQFNPEGSGREASTSYHRLNAEFLTYSTALVMGIMQTKRKNALQSYDFRKLKRLEPANKQKYDLNSKGFFPSWYWDRLFLAGIFTKDMMNMNQEIVQIGDNDSGRLLKLSPIGKVILSQRAIQKYENLAKWKPFRKLFFDEKELDHTTLLSAIAGLRNDCNELAYAAKILPLENSIVRAMCGGFEYPLEITKTLSSKDSICFYSKEIPMLPYRNMKRFSFDEIKQPLTEGLEFIYYPKFGVCLFKSETLFLCAVVDTTRYISLTGHAHNDKLSLELVVEGKSILRDPGSYVYTSDYTTRNIMRSVVSHATICVEGWEQNRCLSPFRMENRSRGYIVEKNGNHLKLYAEYGEVKHSRDILINEKEIIITDLCNMPFLATFNQSRFSNGFGKMIRRKGTQQHGGK